MSGVRRSLTRCFPFPYEGKQLVNAVCSGHYNTQCRGYTRLSDEAKDFIDRFLRVDPENRISLEDVATITVADS